MKYISYITLKVQATQNVSIQNGLTWPKPEKLAASTSPVIVRYVPRNNYGYLKKKRNQTSKKKSIGNN